MRSFFEFIKYFFENIMFTPFNALRKLELTNWWLTNSITWVMIAILFFFLIYWIKQLAFFSKQGTERTDVTAHSFFK